jgi:hypothetical protein
MVDIMVLIVTIIAVIIASKRFYNFSSSFVNSGITRNEVSIIFVKSKSEKRC